MAAVGDEWSSNTSDAEEDSDAEDLDVEQELGHWLEQLESVSKVLFTFTAISLRIPEDV